MTPAEHVRDERILQAVYLCVAVFSVVMWFVKHMPASLAIAGFMVFSTVWAHRRAKRWAALDG